jgi:hypothetical protein
MLTDGIEVRLALLSYIDSNVHVIYSPALDLYGYGNDENEARDSFSITLDEYISFATTQNTLAQDLQRLGWTINPQHHSVKMPLWTNLLATNPHLYDVVANRPFKKFDQPTRFPALA